MAIQTSFSLNHKHAYAGMIADGQLHNNVSRVNNTDSTIPYGTPVWDEALFVGLTIYEVYNRNYHMGTVAGFNVGDTMSIMNAGVMWVQLPEDLSVTAGDKVSFDDATGKFVATGGKELPGALWVADAEAGELAKLRLTIGA